MNWVAIIMCIYFLSIFGGMAVENYSRSQCKISYAQSNKTVNEINQLCR